MKKKVLALALGTVLMGSAWADTNIQKPKVQNLTVENTKNIKNGPYTEYYENGQKRAEGHYVDGVQEGYWAWWYEDGKPWAERNFVNGKENGKSTSWYKSGQKKFSGQYLNGKQSGEWTWWHENGKFKNKITY